MFWLSTFVAANVSNLPLRKLKRDQCDFDQELVSSMDPGGTSMLMGRGGGGLGPGLQFGGKLWGKVTK